MRKGIYQDNKGKWFIHTKKQGRNITIRGFNSKKEANDNYDYEIQKWFLNHELSIVENSYQNAKKEFIEYRQKLVRPESLRKDITQFKYFEPIFKDEPIRIVFDSLRLKIVYNDIISNNELSKQKQNQLVITFREFAKFCYMTNRIDKTSFDSVFMTFLPIKVNRHDTKDKRYMPRNDFNALISTISSKNDNLFKLAISVLYFGGLRISELLGLYDEDIDLNKRVIKVKRQKLTNGSITTTLKTNNSYRTIPMNNELFDLFKNFELIDKIAVFDYSHTSFKRKLKHYEDLARIPNYSAHEFRHTFCSNLAKKISNISEVNYCAKVSGHTTSVFLNTYVKSLDEELVDKFF